VLLLWKSRRPGPRRPDCRSGRAATVSPARDRAFASMGKRHSQAGPSARCAAAIATTRFAKALPRHARYLLVVRSRRLAAANADARSSCSPEANSRAPPDRVAPTSGEIPGNHMRMNSVLRTWLIVAALVAVVVAAVLASGGGGSGRRRRVLARTSCSSATSRAAHAAPHTPRWSG
jgi:hypothetical protein